MTVPADSLTYLLAYDARAHLFPGLWLTAAGLILAAAGSFLWKHPRLGTWTPLANRLFAGVFITVSLGWTVFAATTLSYQHWRLRWALSRGRFRTIEGPVTDFSPGDPDGHFAERWCVTVQVSFACYAYRSSEVTPGYGTIQARGGVIREGLRVRIADVDGHIARLEVAP